MARRRAKLAAFNPAGAPGAQYPGQHPSTDPWLGAIMDAGRKFWASRGVQLPDHIDLDVADDLRLTDDPAERAVGGRGAIAGQPRVALLAHNVDMALALARRREATTRQRRNALKPISRTLLHELGHVGNVPHQEGENVGFMGELAGGDVPQEVARAIRRLVPRQPPVRRARRSRRGGGSGVG